jgi:UDP-N-acetylglucosamine--N-acetylmuramyl-(pentapeptide) pyrophosphoryl-undecaprenol N-acetylglucosamine transferase
LVTGGQSFRRRNHFAGITSEDFVNNPATRKAIHGLVKVPRIIVGGIGTGGHYFPAVVVAQALQKRAPDVIFLVRKGSIEESVAQDHGLMTFAIYAQPFYGKSLMRKILFVFSMLVSVYRLHGLTRHAIGLAFGGFGAVPLIVSCMINRSSYYIFEPNRVPGRATKRFAASAKRVFLGLPSVKRVNRRAIVTGIPVRKEFKKAASGHLHKKLGTRSILFYGGSQGARRLNDLALELQGLLPRGWRFTIISGIRDHERVTLLKSSQTRVLPFTEKPWDEIRDADIVVSRAGALAGYEILCLGKKVIFIPFPYAIDDHQYYNAEYFTLVGDALLCAEKDLTAEMLAERIRELLKRKMRGAKNIIRDAEENIVAYLLGDLVYENI